MARSWMCVLVLTLPALAFADSRDARPPISGGSAAAGGAHSVLSLPDGRVLAWGKGSQGQLGNGDQRSRSAPTPVAGLSDITMVAAGSAHSLARSSAGLVYAWGANGSGQLGDGSIATRRRPVPVLLLKNVVAIAGGRAHSLALTADGRVFSWGANDQGQLGLGSTLDVTIPTEITTLSGIVAIAAGHSHSLAITRNGELFAWGGNAHGQLGDGSRAHRVTPMRINLDVVIAIAAGRSHTLALLRTGEVYSWGRGTFGQLGTGSPRFETKPQPIAGLKAIAIETGANFSAAVRTDRVLVSWGVNRSGQLGDGTTINRPRPVEVRGLVGVSTLALGDAHAIAVTSDGSVHIWGNRSTTPLTTIAGIPNWGPPLGTVESPAIEPPGGLYNTAQTVALKTNGSFIDVRYTLDGTEPTPQSQLYGQPLMVSTATIVRARAFSASGGISTTSTAVFSFQYGALAPPVISPSGGTFAQAPVVTITSLPGASIRYTLDGTDPDDASALYTRPIQIPSTGASLQARAWHVDWSPSAIVRESYVTDTTPPTIATEVAPPLVDGWMTAPITVTFICEDDSGHVNCPAPAVVDTDGRDQLIRGTATDAAGNQASTSIVVSIDLQPPTIEVIDSPDRTAVAESDLTLNVRVLDAGSGVDQLVCNGSAVAVSADIAACLVSLRPGVNSITLLAKDAVGHIGAVGLTVTRVGVAATIQLSPAQRTMVVDEVARFSLRDNFGTIVAGAAWRSSDESIIALSSDDPPQVTAKATGMARLTAEKDGLSTEAEIVVMAGLEIAPGTTRWTLKPTPGFTMGSPIFTSRFDSTTPALFAVETRTWGEATLHALTSEGEVLWRQESPGIPLMGDAFGGLIAGVLFDPNQGLDYHAYVRLGNAGGVPPWRYDSRGRLEAPAQAANGTIYATEYVDTGLRSSDGSTLQKHLIMLDGRTGARINSILLEPTRNSFISQNNGTSGCRSTNVEKPADTIGPVVDAEGRAYFLVRRFQSVKTDVCNEPTTFRAARTIDVGVDLFVLEPGKPVITHPIYSEHCSSPAGGLVVCDVPVTIHQLVPDGMGGVLAKWDRATKASPTVIQQTAISRVASDGSVAEHPVATQTWLYSVGQAGTAYLLSLGGYRAIDVRTWTPIWTSSLGLYTPIAAHPDGGLAVHDELNGLYKPVTSAGQLDSSSAMPLPLKEPYQQFGSWIGRSTDGLRAVAGEFPDATRWHFVGGNAQRNLRLGAPGIGIFVKSHTVQEPITFQHVSIRITPTFQDFWKKLKAADFVNRDEFGNYFTTIGAGTAEGDSNRFCLGALTKGINRERDVAARPLNLEQLPVGPLEEVRLINDFYVYFGNYRNDLPYACVPEMHEGKYNSNSFARGLLQKAGAPLPLFPTRFRIPPGWSKPVPPEKFDP
jgi:alpha-tubulin suppressor-like RCC1 family protein